MALMMTVVVIVMLAIAIAATIAVVVVMPAHVDLLIRSWKNSRRLGPSYLAMPIEPPLGMPIAAAMVWLTDAARPGGTYIVVPAFT
jgi:hypothetical protein